ncbi:bifunctional demethylmenaquinone methyltransferase/2-methoxy-6-polyprenyl-1,4-benzoquinol methylase UbiE [Candidatus Poribacteria bacterium]|nr:bifunctional demethylmenaquinone methyltransferase/2-methoxy-6-polyprenyl-1,4-benzoquinol methylase UbiE [Candidatus Poribacteria bacterium]MYF56493.1 bifunctional demethylmenaquinone methyltransferase/2-methoxy-6-polyprenyl-1,4-benzoquinol methylase UbiE [Candidatus Poribacteria bacterium]
MQAHRIKKLFSAVARHYDFLNSLLSLRLDGMWRRETVKVSDVNATSSVLDVCTGTGELALAYADKIGADGTVIGSDFCFEMLEVAQKKIQKKKHQHAFMPVEADTLSLPFPDNTFDIVSVGFGIRNVSDLKLGIREMTRVANNEGRIAILEFTQPVNPVFRGLYYFYFTKILPFIGNRISRNKDDAYGYLPRSVMQFPSCDELKTIMEQCGLSDVQYYRKTFGIVAIHVGIKA